MLLLSLVAYRVHRLVGGRDCCSASRRHGRPRTLLAWVLILYLAIGRLAHHASLSWQFLVLLAGVHLLHILGMLALELPWRSWVAAALVRGAVDGGSS